ncbi:hypothetical protein ABIB40_002892 [Pedobacter sp. UYP30]|uniref:hypothetical protein n=1 Tax=Pedobacter sp. UYP30 TaxID=1756400 RepID=UPI003396AE55
MNLIKTTALSFLFSCMCNCVFGQDLKPVKTANDVLEHAITAQGGKDYLLSIKTLYTDMSTEMEGRQVHWITKEMLPNKGAFQIIYKDRIVFQNWYDGKTGYEMVDGKKTKADPKEFKSKKYRKNIFNNLDFIDPSLWTIELIGAEKVNDDDCYKIKASLVTGEIRNLYYSKSSFFMLREDKTSNADKNSFSSTFFSDFKKFGGLTFYTVIKFGDDEKAQVGKIASLIVNDKVTVADFQ